MTSPDDIGQMPTGDFSRLEGLCEQLEQAWKEFQAACDLFQALGDRLGEAHAKLAFGIQTSLETFAPSS